MNNPKSPWRSFTGPKSTDEQHKQKERDFASKRLCRIDALRAAKKLRKTAASKNSMKAAVSGT